MDIFVSGLKTIIYQEKLSSKFHRGVELFEDHPDILDMTWFILYTLVMYIINVRVCRLQKLQLAARYSYVDRLHNEPRAG